MNDDDEQLQLPSGAFIAFRQSGGLRFRSREVIVYHDGRVITRRQGKLGAGEGSRHITPTEVADLKALIERSRLRELPRSVGRPSPDGYAYELIVRLNRGLSSIEFFDGSIPSEMKTVLARLKALSASDDATK